MSRRTKLRARGTVLAAACAFILSGCISEGGSSSLSFGPKHLQPLSSHMLALIEQKGMDKDSPILLRIFKEEAELEVWKQTRHGRFELLKTYPICRWSGELGPKVREGDRQAPEGYYFITPELMNPRSSYYLAFNLGYPNEFDRAHGRTGSHLMVHGDCSSRGCYSMTDEQISEIFALAREAFDGGQLGFYVHAYPFRMTGRNLARHRKNPHLAFWRMLKEGNDHFEVTGQQPKIDICNRRYVFDAHLHDPSQLFDPKAPCPPYSVPAEIATRVAAKRQADERQFAFLSNLVPAAPVVTGRDGGTNPAFAAAPAPAVTVASEPAPAPPASAASSGPTGGTLVAALRNVWPFGSGSSASATRLPTADVPLPPIDPRRRGSATARTTPTPPARSAASPPVARARPAATRSSEPAETPQPVARPEPEKQKARTLPGATPIRSTGGFSFQ